MTGAATALRELSARILAAGSVDEVLDATVDALRDALAVDRVHVSEVSEDRAVCHTRAVGFEAGRQQIVHYVQVIDDRPSALAHVVAGGRTHAVADARTSSEIRADYVSRFRIASAYFVPAAWRGEVRYVAGLITHEPRILSEEEIALAEALVNVTAAALAVQESDRRHAAQHERDAALARAAKALNESLELQNVLATLAREADLALGGDMAGVYLGDATTGGVATAGHNTPPDWPGYVMSPGEGVAGQVIATGTPAISNAYQSDVRLPAQRGLQRLQTAVSVPVRWGGELRGALSVGFARLRRVTDEDLRTLEAIADLAGVACRNAETFERLEAATHGEKARSGSPPGDRPSAGS